MNRQCLLSITLALLMSVGLTMAVLASDLAIYSGPTNPGWISPASAQKNADTIMNDNRMKALFKNIVNFGDGDEVGSDSALGKWMIAHTGNSQQDVFIAASGTAPSAIYQFPNEQPDGSNIENFVDDGNVFINVADWILYMSYEGGSRSPDNGPAGASNVFDVPGLSFGSRVNDMIPTDMGAKYIPSLKAFASDRPWHVEQFADTDWELTLFAKSDDDNADPAVAVHKTTGGIIAAMWQKAQPDWADGEDPRGVGVIEFIDNWLTENGNLAPTVAVDPLDKATTTWGMIKQLQ